MYKMTNFVKALYKYTHTIPLLTFPKSSMNSPYTIPPLYKWFNNLNLDFKKNYPITFEPT
jgi:hypothetical protein